MSPDLISFALALMTLAQSRTLLPTFGRWITREISRARQKGGRKRDGEERKEGPGKREEGRIASVKPIPRAIKPPTWSVHDF